jgi:hypothetical protein
MKKQTYNNNNNNNSNYIACDVGAVFEAAGFECRTKYLASATKVWTFVKPQPAAAAAAKAAAEAAASAAGGSAGDNDAAADAAVAALN